MRGWEWWEGGRKTEPQRDQLSAPIGMETASNLSWILALERRGKTCPIPGWTGSRTNERVGEGHGAGKSIGNLDQKWEVETHEEKLNESFCCH